MTKKIIVLGTALILMLLTVQASAIGRWGVTGGFNFSNSEQRTYNRGTMTRFHAGLTWQMKLPLGFSVQPSLLYSEKGAKLDGIFGREFSNTFDTKVGYLELPVSFQWGPDLLLFRPFLDITPFVGYALTNSFSFAMHQEGAEPYVKKDRNDWGSSGMNRFEYGLGLGVGLEIWKFQVMAKYFWNFGSLSHLNGVTDGSDYLNTIMNTVFTGGKNFQGLTLSVSFLF